MGILYTYKNKMVYKQLRWIIQIEQCILQIKVDYDINCFGQKGRVWKYQRGNHNPYIEEEQATQWPKLKVQKDTQRSTKHKYTTNDRVTRTPL